MRGVNGGGISSGSSNRKKLTSEDKTRIVMRSLTTNVALAKNRNNNHGYDIMPGTATLIEKDMQRTCLKRTCNSR
jgi:hypothetical protein